MQGIFTFYINWHPDIGQDHQQTIDLFKQVNKDLIEQINTTTGYTVCIVPTTKESCRMEKVDFDKPCPRFVSKMHIDLADLEKRREQRAAERNAYKQQQQKEEQ